MKRCYFTGASILLILLSLVVCFRGIKRNHHQKVDATIGGKIEVCVDHLDTEFEQAARQLTDVFVTAGETIRRFEILRSKVLNVNRREFKAVVEAGKLPEVVALFSLQGLELKETLHEAHQELAIWPQGVNLEASTAFGRRITSQYQARIDAVNAILRVVLPEDGTGTKKGGGNGLG
jgi:hypothetical protein